MRIKAFLSVGVILLLSSVLTLAALDLKFTTAITQSPDPASAGNTVTFKVSFKTAGGPVTNLKIIGGIDATQIFTRTYASIAADKLKTDTFTWTATAGSHKAWFVLDPNHTAGDSNYNNNRVEKAFTVSGSLVPSVSNKPAVNAVTMVNPNLLSKYIKVTDPHSGDSWRYGNNYFIKWETDINDTGVAYYISLYSTDKKDKLGFMGMCYCTSFDWKVNWYYPGDYRIGISAYIGKDEELVQGFSDVFNIFK